MTALNVFAIDYSGATSNEINYWKKVSEQISPTTNENTKYIFWNNKRNPTVIDKEKVQERIKTCEGYYGTDPSTFIPAVAKLAERVSDICLTIITDGQVGKEEIKNCDKKMEEYKIKLKEVTVHLIGDERWMDLSVPAPFIRNSKCQRTILNGKEISKGEIVPINLEQYQDQPEKFIQDAPHIMEQLVLQNLGNYNQQMHNKVINLQKELLKQISTDKSSTNKSQFKALRDALSSGNYDLSIETMQEIISISDCELGKKIEQNIQKMLEILKKSDSPSGLSFDALRANRWTHAPEMKNVTPDDLADVSLPCKEYLTFECPVYLDKDVPVLFIKEGAPILKDLEKKYQDYLINNPLAMLDNPDLVKALKARLDHPIGFKAAQKLFQKHEVLAPLTRAKIKCFISTANEISHNEATNYSLANLFFGDQLVGLPDLWLAVVFSVAKGTEYLSLKEDKTPSVFIENFKELLITRMKNNVTNITLSGSPIKPFIKCPVDLALWYCVVSPQINHEGEENRLRSIGTQHHLDLLDMFNYPYKKEWTSHQLNIYREFKRMMHRAKENDADFRKTIHSLYQNSMTLSNGTIVLLDGSPTKNSSLFESISIPEALFLASLVKKQDKAGVAVIPNKLGVLPIPESKKNYGYPDNKELHQELKISTDTMRPFMYDRSRKKHWKECAESTFGCPTECQLSAYNYFIVFVNEKNKFPDKEEFISWMADKQANRQENAMDTLPKEVLLIVDDVFAAYTKAGIDLDSKEVNSEAVKKFISVTNRSRSKEDRARLDGSLSWIKEI